MNHAAVRHGLALVLTKEGIAECREAAGREEAFSAASSERPDLALVDLSPERTTSSNWSRTYATRNIPVLVCSMHDRPRPAGTGGRGLEVARAAIR